MSTVRLEFNAQIRNQNNQLITQAKTIMVCVDKNLKPQAIPDEIRNKIK